MKTILSRVRDWALIPFNRLHRFPSFAEIWVQLESSSWFGVWRSNGTVFLKLGRLWMVLDTQDRLDTLRRAAAARRAAILG